MRVALFVSILGLLTGAAYAEVYKSVDAEGNVTYSDTPRGGGERVSLPNLTEYDAKAVPDSQQGLDLQGSPGTTYESIRFLNLHDQQTIQNIAGNLVVEFEVIPALLPGHRVLLLLDAQVGAEIPGTTVEEGVDSFAASATISNVPRGQHTLQARIVDAMNVLVYESIPITLYIHAPSRLLPAANGALAPKAATLKPNASNLKPSNSSLKPTASSLKPKATP